MTMEQLEIQGRLNYAARLFRISTNLDSRAWSAHTRQAPERDLRYLAFASSSAITGAFDQSEREGLYRSINDHLELTHHETVFRPQLAYDNSEILPPRDFTDPNLPYANMDAFQRSVHMRGNAKLATEVVLWVIADRVGSWPSLVDSNELNKLVLAELAELQETDQVTDTLIKSPLHKAIHRDKSIPWYLDENAEDIWDVVSEIADVAFCSMQYWLAYDGMTVEESIESGKRVIEHFDSIDRHVTNEYLRQTIDNWLDGSLQLSKDDWPEMLLGVGHLLSKRIGVDIWEAITLKCLANIRQYPQVLQLVEKDVDRRMDDARTPAWIFMKNSRRGFSPKKRFIPPMSDVFARETILDVLYKSPYLETHQFSLGQLAQMASQNGVEYAIPEMLATLDASKYSDESRYY